MFYKNYKPIWVSLPWIIVYPKLKEVSYIAWQKKYPTLKTNCHIKPKFILWTPRQLASYNQTWRNQTKKFLLEKIFSTQRKNFLYLHPSPLPPPKEKKNQTKKLFFGTARKKVFQTKNFQKLFISVVFWIWLCYFLYQKSSVSICEASSFFHFSIIFFLYATSFYFSTSERFVYRSRSSFRFSFFPS